jgi:hypothetical protein
MYENEVIHTSSRLRWSVHFTKDESKYSMFLSFQLNPTTIPPLQGKHCFSAAICPLSCGEESKDMITVSQIFNTGFILFYYIQL